MKKISRKSFIGKAILSVFGGTFLAGCLSDQPDRGSSGPAVQTDRRFRWNMVTCWPPNFPILGEGCNHFSQWVNEMSQGQFQIRVYGGGELIPAFETFDVVSSGTAQLGHGAAYYWAGKVPAAQFFASVPFGMNAQQNNAWILAGGGMELWREVYAPFQLIPFLAGNTNAQMGGWFNREIKTIDDLKGLKMRIPGLGGRVIEKAGGTAVLSPGSEIYTNLERGVIDATEWVGPYHDYLMGFHKIARYYYSPGWHEAGTSVELIVNKQNFESLPHDLQVILETAALRLNQWMMAEGEVKNSEYLEILKKESDVEIRPFPAEVIAVLKKHTKDIIQDLVRKDPMAARIYESFSHFKELNRAWSEITEKAFYNEIA